MLLTPAKIEIPVRLYVYHRATFLQKRFNVLASSRYKDTCVDEMLLSER
jgi:hypothetical protein